MNTHDTRHFRKHHVNGRFSVLCLSGLRVIELYCHWRKLSFEKQCVLVSKWFSFIYFYSPFSKCQRELLSKRLKLFWLRFLNSPIFLCAVAGLGLLLSLVVVYLTTKYKLK